MQFFLNHPLKEMFFYDIFDYLLCVDQSPVSVFIPLSSASLAFLSIPLISSQGMLIYLRFHSSSELHAYFFIVIICKKSSSLFHICYSIMTRLFQYYFSASSNLSLHFLHFPPFLLSWGKNDENILFGANEELQHSPPARAGIQSDLDSRRLSLPNPLPWLCQAMHTSFLLSSSLWLD